MLATHGVRLWTPLTGFFIEETGEARPARVLPVAWLAALVSSAAVLFGAKSATAVMTCQDFCGPGVPCCQGTWQNGNTCYACCSGPSETPVCDPTGPGSGCYCY